MLFAFEEHLAKGDIRILALEIGRKFALYYGIKDLRQVDPTNFTIVQLLEFHNDIFRLINRMHNFEVCGGLHKHCRVVYEKL